MKRTSSRGAFIACAVGLTSTAALATPIHENRPADSDALVTIHNVNGTVTVQGWGRKEVEVTGTLSEDAESLDVTGTASRLKIEVHYPENARHIRAEADLDVKVPMGAGVRVNVVNAPITVSKVEGELELEAVNGNIDVADRPARIAAQTVNGSIHISATSPHVEAETVGGRILLDGIGGDVAAGSVGGSIRVTGGKFERAKLSSVSGDIDFAGDLPGKGTLQSESHSGDIVLHLPADVSAEFEVSTFSGHIDNDFGPSGSKRGFGPGRAVSFSTGKGEASLTISTFSGDIRLVKK